MMIMKTDLRVMVDIGAVFVIVCYFLLLLVFLILVFICVVNICDSFNTLYSPSDSSSALVSHSIKGLVCSKKTDFPLFV